MRPKASHHKLSNAGGLLFIADSGLPLAGIIVSGSFFIEVTRGDATPRKASHLRFPRRSWGPCSSLSGTVQADSSYLSSGAGPLPDPQYVWARRRRIHGAGSISSTVFSFHRGLSRCPADPGLLFPEVRK